MGITAKRLWYREINKKRGTKKGSEILKRKLRGSYTVEAAILMPLALGVILFVLSGVLFLHDRVWLECWVYGTAEQQAFRKEQREEEHSWPDYGFNRVSRCEGKKCSGKRSWDGSLFSGASPNIVFSEGTENGGFCAGETPLWRTGCKSAEENGR